MSTKTCNRCGNTKQLSQFYSLGKGKLRPECIECTKTWRAEHKEQIAAQKRAYHSSEKWRKRRKETRNRDRENEQRRAAYATNPQADNARSVSWKRANRKRVAEYGRRYATENPEANRRRARIRMQRQRLATPPWADLEAMRAMYTRAAELAKATGIPHHVDHIYPIKGKDSCGLHIPLNLQIVPASVNDMKRNKLPKLDGEVRCCAWPSIPHFEALYGAAA